MTIEQIEQGFVELYQKKVLEVGAYRTGALYDSIECIITIDPAQGPNVEIAGIEYLPFVDEGTRYISPRHITDKWLADPRWDYLFEQLVNIWVDDYLDENIDIV